MFRTNTALAFLDFVEKTESVIYIPRIVWQEVEKNYRQDLETRQNQYVQTCKHMAAVLINMPEFKVLKIDIDSEVASYMEWLRKKLKIREDYQFIEHKPDYLERVAARALVKRRPFNDKNQQEFKDTLIWENVLDVISGAAGKEHDEVVFISSDGNAFGVVPSGGGKKVLHSDLAAEAEEARQKGKTQGFYYYTSLEDFVSAHSLPIQGITEESVGEYLRAQKAALESAFAIALQEDVVDFANAARLRNPEYQLPLIESDLAKHVVTDTSDVFALNVYTFEKTKRIVIFCRVYLTIEVPLTFAPLDNPESIRVHSAIATYQVSLSIQFKDGEMGEIKIEHVGLTGEKKLAIDNSYQISALLKAIDKTSDVSQSMEEMKKQFALLNKFSDMLKEFERINKGFYSTSQIERADKVIEGLNSSVMEPPAVKLPPLSPEPVKGSNRTPRKKKK